MIGYDDASASEGLIRARERPRNYLLSLSAALLVVGATSSFFWTHDSKFAKTQSSLSASAGPEFWYGATLGGWLVMEINPTTVDGIHPDMRPSWMFDQITARSELDFVTELRESKGDAYAITTSASAGG